MGSASQLAKERLALECGRIDKQAPFTVGLVYPSPYRVGMSSLGFQQIYKMIQAEPGMACERLFLPDNAGSGPLDYSVRSYESLRPLEEFELVAFSVAYELELAGMVQLLEGAGVSALRLERGAEAPLVLAGGPLTFSNPLPLAAFSDAIIMGEADTLILDVLRELREAENKQDALRRLAELNHVFVPEHHGDSMPSLAQCDDDVLPAWAPIRTPDTELSNMFLIETERGCSRGCTYCVMRRSTNGGMRLVDKAKLLSLVPEDAPKVGLVGAAVSDHPQIVDIVTSLVERGCGVGLSSLRPDRLKRPFVAALRAGGYRTLTTAMDGTSNRVRQILDRRTKQDHLRKAAEVARSEGMSRLKLYLMIGTPGEVDEDVDECVEFVTELSRMLPVALAIAPFCAKRNTPLDGQPFAGIKVVDRRLDRLRRGLRGRADVRSTSARWAWVEYVLSQGGVPEAEALRLAVHNGGRFAHYKRAFAERPQKTKRKQLFVVRSAPKEGRRDQRWLEPTT